MSNTYSQIFSNHFVNQKEKAFITVPSIFSQL